MDDKLLEKWAEGFDEFCLANNVDASELVRLSSLYGAKGLDKQAKGMDDGLLRDMVKMFERNAKKVKIPSAGKGIAKLFGKLGKYPKLKLLGLLGAAGLTGGAMLGKAKEQEVWKHILGNTALSALAGTAAGAGYETLRTDKEEEDRNVLRAALIGGAGGGVLGGGLTGLSHLG